MSVDIHHLATSLSVAKDKHLYAVDGLPLLTVYDDNWFVRNDYDVLSSGQRQHIQHVLAQQGFSQKTGKTMQCKNIVVEFPTPRHILALSSFQPHFLMPAPTIITAITPTTFAETLFYQMLEEDTRNLNNLKQLIDKCPYNIELLRDISINSPIESLTAQSYHTLVAYQADIVERKFKRKKAL